MNTIKNKKLLLQILIVASIALGILTRYLFLGTHFSHVDDLTPLRSILEWKKYPVLENWLSNPTHPWASLFKFFNSIHLLMPLSILVDTKNQAFGVAGSSTYAPLQFLLTSLLIHPEMSYEQLIFWGRMPSFLIGSASILMIGYLIKKIFQNNSLVLVLIAILLISFSLENIVYTVQVESYAIGVLILIIYLILFFRMIDKSDLNFIDLIVIMLSTLVFSWSQYQFLFFLPGFYLGLIFHGSTLKDKRYLFKSIGVSIAAFLSVLPIYSFMSKTGLLGRGVNWNAGVSGEYLFSIIPFQSIFEPIIYILKFFINNTYVVIQSNFTMGYGFLNHPAYFISLLLFMILGLFNVFKKSKPFFIFIMTTKLVWMGLVILRILTLSPTRHSLILFPLQVVLLLFGLDLLFDFMRRNSLSFLAYFKIIILTVLYTGFFASIIEVYESRIDPFNESKIDSLVQSFQVDHILSYGWTWNLHFMDYPKLYLMDIGIYGKMNDTQSDTIAFIGHRDPMASDAFTYVVESLNQLDGQSYSTNIEDYILIYSEEIKSDVEIDSVNYTKNGTNGYYFYVFKIKKLY